MLGEKLRQEREKRNLTISDIETGTSIRALYIDCLEKGDYAKLPGEVYVKGFIRNYANFLKMDADALVRQYTEENHPEQIQAGEAAPDNNETNRNYGSAPFSTGDDFRKRVEESNRKQNMVLLVVVCLVVVAGAFFMMSSNDEPGKGSKPSVQQSVQNSSHKPAQKPQTPVPAQSANAAAQTQVPANEVELAVNFVDRCWIQVIADGTTLYEGVIEAGKTASWKGKEKIEFTAGNAGAVEVTVNGTSLGKPGEEGQVAEKTYTKTGEVSNNQQAVR